MEFSSTNTSLQGSLNMKIQNGVVISASDSGFFAGIAPGVGATVPLDLSVPNELDFECDLGDHDGHDLDVGIDMYGAGETTEEAASEPVNAATATHLFHYQLQSNPPMPVQVAGAAMIDRQTVSLLVHPPFEAGGSSMLMVFNVTDLAGNPGQAGPPVSFTCPLRTE